MGSDSERCDATEPDGHVKIPYANAQSVAVGYEAACVITGLNGTVLACTGVLFGNYPNPTGWAQVSISNFLPFFCALDRKGRAFCMGAECTGQFTALS